MKKEFLVIVSLIFCPALFFGTAQAKISSSEVVPAMKGKKNRYHGDIIVRGGDPLANPVSLKNIRWSPNTDFERLVIDLEGESAGWRGKVPPYFIIGISAMQRKISIGIRGIHSRKVDQQKINNVFSRSNLLKGIYMSPALEGDLTTMEIALKQAVRVESFYLVHPPRIILDVKKF